MKLKAIWLHNIRSYRDQVIVFPERGITVIYGDVGTGKSTILSSITFAIFGSSPAQRYDPAERYAAPKAEDLLRKGASRGFVQLWLRMGSCDEGGKTSPCRDVIICRNIAVEGGSIRDKGGSLIVYNHDEGRVEEARRYSAVELRSRVLQILGLPEKERGSPLIFTNAIYVPQFNVYTILTMSPQERKEAINRALNLVKYNNIRGNIEELARHLRGLMRERQTLLERLMEEVSRLPEKRRLLEEKKRLLREKMEREEKLRKMIAELEDERRKLLEELEELAKLKGRHDELSRRLEALEKEVRSAEEQFKDLGGPEQVKKRLETLEREIEKLQQERARLLDEQEKITRILTDLDAKESELHEQVSKRRRELEEARSTASIIEGQIKTLESRLAEVERLVEAGKCPTCEQPVSRSHGASLVSKLKARIEELKGRLGKAREESSRLEKALRELEDTLRRLRDQRHELGQQLRTLQAKASSITSKLDNLSAEREELARAEELARRLEEKRAEAEKVRADLAALKGEVARYSEIEVRLKRLEEELGGLKEELERIVNEAGQLRGEVGEMERSVEELEAKRREVEELGREVKILERMLSFVKEREHRADLVRIVDEIESYVKRRAHQIFQYEFRRLFSRLMEGQEGITVDIDQDFTPVYRISIGASSHEITLPSGGQVASVGLAYRLALNTVARAMVPQLSKGLLILDEPTYGFSPERVEKLREVLEELDAEQIIIVTHDQNLLPAGHYHIRLSLDRSMVTSVEYEGFTPDELEQLEKSVKLMRRIGCSAVWASETPSHRGGFKPLVKTQGSSEPAKPKSGTLLDFAT